MSYAIWIIIICVILFFVRRFLNRFKLIKSGSITYIAGGVGTGKTTLAVATVDNEWKPRHRAWKIRCFFLKLFGKKELPEEPLIYSNVPLKCKYVPITKGLLFRQQRFNYNSVVFFSEASLIADSMLIRDPELNERLCMFYKLIRHHLHGGCLVVESQNPQDVHFSLKRSISNYIYIHHLTRWIPFVLIAHVREMTYFDGDQSVVNAVTGDTEDSLKKVIFWKRTWKKFDTLAYSYLTDNLPVVNNVVNGKELDDLKVRRIVSFRRFDTLPRDLVYDLNLEEIKRA